MGHHHITQLPPVVVVAPAAKVEKTRKRQALRLRDGAQDADAEAVNDGDMVHALDAARDEARRKSPRQGAQPKPLAPDALPHRALTDETMRALLVCQELNALV